MPRLKSAVGEQSCKVYFHEIFGSQEYKKEYLKDKSIYSEKLIKLEDDEKYHWFTKVKSNEKYLNEFIGLTEIFDIVNNGIETHKDSLAIQLTKEKLENILNDFRNLSENEIFEKYNVKNGRDWRVNKAQKDIIENNGNIEIVHYRHFDFRYTYYSKNQGFVAYPRYNAMKHILNKENIGLIFTRNVTDNDYRHAFISSKIIDAHVNSGRDYIAPLYLYEENSAGDLNFENSCKPNWTNSFNEFLKNYISDNPREILNYIYAILYCPTYRKNYKEDLKYDYPRIPFTKDKNIFDRMQTLGGELIDLHLLRNVNRHYERSEIIQNKESHYEGKARSNPDKDCHASLRSARTRCVPYGNDIESKASYPISGEHKISYSKYNEEEKRIYINEKQYFENVKKEVYDYSIGGYKPIEKYIKAREILTLGDIKHLIRVIAVIERTILLQCEVEEVWLKSDF